MRICILGDSGLLGQALVQKIGGERENEILGISSSEFRPSLYWTPLRSPYKHQKVNLLTEERIFLETIKRFKPDLIINCVALTDLWACEKDPDFAEKINALLPARLAHLSEAQGIDLIHISTDQVFDGQKGRPYVEEDETRPLNVYGRTKLQGEENIIKKHSAVLIVRTNFVGFRDRSRKETFAEWLSRSLLNSLEITLWENYVTSSLHIRDLCDLIWQSYLKKCRGIFHIATRNSLSKYEFGRLLAIEMGYDFSQVQKGRLEENSPLLRPYYLALDVTKGEKALNILFPQCIQTVKKIAQDLRLRLKESCHAN